MNLSKLDEIVENMDVELIKKLNAEIDRYDKSSIVGEELSNLYYNIEVHKEVANMDWHDFIVKVAKSVTRKLIFRDIVSNENDLEGLNESGLAQFVIGEGYMTLGEVLKELRKKKNKTQQEVADEMDIQRVRLTTWENDTSKPRYDMLLELSNYYGVTVGFLTGKEEYKDEQHNMYLEEISKAMRSMSDEDIENMMTVLRIAFKQHFS